MIFANMVSLLLFSAVITVLLLALILVITALAKRYIATEEQPKVMHKQNATNRTLGPSGNGASVVVKAYGSKTMDFKRNVTEVAQPRVATSQSPRIIKRTPKNIDEEHKYTQVRTAPPAWYVDDGTEMILPYYKDATKGVDLRIFPGQCKVYVDGRHSWTANITDLMSAQALWRAAQKYHNVAIEPERPPVVSRLEWKTITERILPGYRIPRLICRSR